MKISFKLLSLLCLSLICFPACNKCSQDSQPQVQEQEDDDAEPAEVDPARDELPELP